MDAKECQCDSIERIRTSYQPQWREVCTKFYFHKDEAAQRVLDSFETSRADDFKTFGTQADEVCISTVDDDIRADNQVCELVQLLKMHKCVVPGHEESLSQTVQMLESVKSAVRAEYHDHVSIQRYTDFETRAKESQGTNYEVWTEANGQQRLSVRVQHDYLRSKASYTTMMERLEAFIEKHLPNIGCHPFLAGLRAALQWNLESSTVVAWKLPDSVFVESGDAVFTHNALKLVASALNFSHCKSTDTTTKPGTSKDDRVKMRDWYLDPYLSDHDIRHLVHLFPAAKRLEGRPTGSKLLTKFDRVNAHGQRDEKSRFFDRWCIVL